MSNMEITDQSERQKKPLKPFTEAKSSAIKDGFFWSIEHFISRALTYIIANKVFPGAFREFNQTEQGKLKLESLYSFYYEKKAELREEIKEKMKLTLRDQVVKLLAFKKKALVRVREDSEATQQGDHKNKSEKLFISFERDECRTINEKEFEKAVNNTLDEMLKSQALVEEVEQRVQELIHWKVQEDYKNFLASDEVGMLINEPTQQISKQLQIAHTAHQKKSVVEAFETWAATLTDAERKLENEHEYTSLENAYELIEFVPKKHRQTICDLMDFSEQGCLKNKRLYFKEYMLLFLFLSKAPSTFFDVLAAISKDIKKINTQASHTSMLVTGFKANGQTTRTVPKNNTMVIRVCEGCSPSDPSYKYMPVDLLALGENELPLGRDTVLCLSWKYAGDWHDRVLMRMLTESEMKKSKALKIDLGNNQQKIMILQQFIRESPDNACKINDELKNLEEEVAKIQMDLKGIRYGVVLQDIYGNRIDDPIEFLKIFKSYCDNPQKMMESFNEEFFSMQHCKTFLYALEEIQEQYDLISNDRILDTITDYLSNVYTPGYKEVISFVKNTQPTSTQKPSRKIQECLTFT